jgi:beta-lactamase regulating signal transducer with metallopeptidase domain
MITGLIRDHGWVPAAVVCGAIAVHAGMWGGVIPCPAVSMTACLTAAVIVTGAASLAAIAIRAVQVGRRTARALAALPRTQLPGPARAAALRADGTRVVCLRGGDPTVFCAGLWRPRAYLTSTAARTLSPAELDAVLAHEAAHARRRDPLRRLLNHAAADVLFYLPLTPWLSDRRAEQAELAADRAAIAQTGPRAVASALLSIDPAAPFHSTELAATASFDGAIDARIAQLAGESIPARRPSAKPVMLSLLGLVLMLSLAMCLVQAVPGI